MSKLHLVFGGRVSDPQGTDFVDLHTLDVVGLFPDYKSAEKAWRAAAQRRVWPAVNGRFHSARASRSTATGSRPWLPIWGGRIRS